MRGRLIKVLPSGQNCPWSAAFFHTNVYCVLVPLGTGVLLLLEGGKYLEKKKKKKPTPPNNKKTGGKWPSQESQIELVGALGILRRHRLLQY